MVIYDSWCVLMIADDHRLSLMIIDGHLIIDDHWWSLVIMDDHLWSGIVHADCLGSLTTQLSMITDIIDDHSQMLRKFFKIPLQEWTMLSNPKLAAQQDAPPVASASLPSVLNSIMLWYLSDSGYGNYLLLYKKDKHLTSSIFFSNGIGTVFFCEWLIWWSYNH